MDNKELGNVIDKMAHEIDTLEVFLDVFGSFGDHIWVKYAQYEQNLLTLWCYLDLKNRKKLVDYLLQM